MNDIKIKVSKVISNPHCGVDLRFMNPQLDTIQLTLRDHGNYN